MQRLLKGIPKRLNFLWGGGFDVRLEEATCGRCRFLGRLFCIADKSFIERAAECFPTKLPNLTRDPYW